MTSVIVLFRVSKAPSCQNTILKVCDKRLMRLCLPWHFDTAFLLKAASLGQTPKACCFCLFVQGFYVDGFGVLNGSPLKFAEHSSCADGRPGEDIQGEAEGTQDLLPGSRPDAFPLGNQRPGGQQEGRAVGACQQGQDQDACSAEARESSRMNRMLAASALMFMP